MHNGVQTRRVCLFEPLRDAHEAGSRFKTAGEEDATLLCCTPWHPHDPALSFPTTGVVIRARSACFRGHNCASFHGFCAFGNDANRSIGRVCAAAKKQGNGEPMRGWMQHEHARASSLRSRFGCRRPGGKILAHQAPPPCHLATCRRRGEATIRRDLDGRSQPNPASSSFRWTLRGSLFRVQTTR